MIPLLLGGLFVIGKCFEAADEERKIEEAKRRERLARYRRTGSECRLLTEQVEHSDRGVMQKATRYTPRDWSPEPWVLYVWMDPSEDAEVFAFEMASDIEPRDVEVSVRWSGADPRKEGSVGERIENVGRDERYRNRWIHRYGKTVGAFRLEVSFLGERLTFFHKCVEKRRIYEHLVRDQPSRPTPARSPAPLPSPRPPPPPAAVPPRVDPLAKRVEAFIALQERYEELKIRLAKRSLAPEIEKAALLELERVVQMEVEKLEDEYDRKP